MMSLQVLLYVKQNQSNCIIPHYFTQYTGLHTNCLKVRCVSASSARKPLTSCGSIWKGPALNLGETPWFEHMFHHFKNVESRAWFQRVSSIRKMIKSNRDHDLNSQILEHKTPNISNDTGIQWDWIIIIIIIIISPFPNMKHHLDGPNTFSTPQLNNCSWGLFFEY